MNLLAMDEEKLHHDLVNRSERALGQMIHHYGPVVYALIKRILGPAARPPDVEECVSEAFWRVWQRITYYIPHRSSLRTFILMHAKYAALDWRRQANRATSEDTGPYLVPPVSLPLSSIEERQLIQDALDRLSALDKKIVYLRYYLDQTIRDIAAETGLSETAVETRLWRSKQKLRDHLGVPAERSVVK